MKKNIDLIIDGVAPEKVIYDTDNHSLTVLYPAQEEFKVGDRVVLKPHSMKHLSSYNGFTYFRDMNTSNGSYIVIKEVKIYGNAEKQTVIYGTNSVTGKRYFYPIEWLEHHNAEFKMGDILTAVGHDKNNMTFIYNHFDKYNGLFEALCGGVQINPATKKPQLRDTWIKYGFDKDKVRHATPSEIEQFDNDLKSIGKRWNREILEVEDIKEGFKKGDIVIHDNTKRISIFDSYKNKYSEFNAIFSIGGGGDIDYNHSWNTDTIRYATSSEIEKFDNDLKEIGKKWNREALEIEDLDISEIVYNLSSACSYLNKPVPDFESLLLTISNEDFHKYKAQITLQLIREAWNKFDGFEVDFEDNLQARYYLEMKHYSNGTKVLTKDCYRTYANMDTSCYSFKSRERAIQFGNQFKELFKTAMGRL